MLINILLSGLSYGIQQMKISHKVYALVHPHSAGIPPQGLSLSPRGIFALSGKGSHHHFSFVPSFSLNLPLSFLHPGQALVHLHLIVIQDYKRRRLCWNNLPTPASSGSVA